MKKPIILALVLAASLPINAQTDLDDFDKFLAEENASFDKFIDEANKEFISFLRNPWKKEEAKKPIEKHVVPEPPKPIVFDEKSQPKDKKPVELTIRKILQQTTREGKQQPTTAVRPVDKLTFDSPTTQPTSTASQPKVEPKKPTASPKQLQQEPSKPTVSPKQPQQESSKPTVSPKQPQQESSKPTTVVPKQPQQETSKPTVSPKQPQQETSKPTVSPKQPTAEPAVRSRLFTASAEKMSINYCEQKLYIDASLRGVCRLADTKERTVADAYEALCLANYKQLISDCRQVRTDFRLNDWGVILFVKKAADALCADANSSIVMQQFLLNELGYRAKMARRGDGKAMMLFVATDCMVYGHPYFVQDGINYYYINGTEASQFYICQQNSKKARNNVVMQLTTTPELTSGIVNRQRTNKAGTVSVSVDVPKSLIDFYASMPQCDYGVYAKAPVESNVAEQILGTLRPLVAGKSELAAANLLLNFVQTGFKYATDDEQFGYEKPFFVEELFYYPACDCEDRSVLFAYLVRQLLGLDVVFLDYPNHIATAVAFNDNVAGDYFTVNGKRYTVCDPTYIGASVGQTMPNFKSVAADILHY